MGAIDYSVTVQRDGLEIKQGGSLDIDALSLAFVTRFNGNNVYRRIQERPWAKVM